MGPELLSHYLNNNTRAACQMLREDAHTATQQGVESVACLLKYKGTAEVEAFAAWIAALQYVETLSADGEEVADERCSHGVLTPFVDCPECEAEVQVRVVGPYTGTDCLVCRLPLYATPSGPVCDNGHGGG